MLALENGLTGEKKERTNVIFRLAVKVPNSSTNVGSSPKAINVIIVSIIMLFIGVTNFFVTALYASSSW